VFRGDHALDFDEIGSGDLVAGMENPLGQIPIIGQEEDSLRLDVQAADMN
jgi:hypothetical protein